MTTTLSDVSEDSALTASLATLWQRHRQTNLDRISLLEGTAANVLRLTIDGNGIEEGSRAAHMLAGSLGTFGFDAGSRAALEAEYLLREEVIDGLRLAEAVSALRASVQEDQVAPVVALAPTSTDPVASGATATVRFVSGDASLIARLTVEAAAVGISVVASPELPSTSPSATAAAVIIDDDGTRTWEDSQLLPAIHELAGKTAVLVLTDHDDLDDRMALARAGVAGVADRSQSARQVVTFFAEVVARQSATQSVVRACTAGAGSARLVAEAFAGHDDHLESYDDVSDLWVALEEQGADLLVVGFDGPLLSGPELCRVVRGHARWHGLPVVVLGGSRPGDLAEAMAAGADDVLPADISAGDLGVRLRSVLANRRIARIRSDIDLVTGTENRTAVERSLDRVFRSAMRNDVPFALALVRIDQFDHLRSTEGNAVGDELLRRLGSRLVSGVGTTSVIGRWTDSSFAVGLYGVTSEGAAERIAGVLATLSAQGVPTTSGYPVHCTFSAGVTAAPADGSTFTSLERRCETALQRATAGEDSVVISGNRPAGPGQRTVDVVIVEDDDSVAEVIEHALGLHQYGSVRFNDGAEAASALGEGRVTAQVVLLDVGLPSLDGFGVLAALRAKGVLETTRVIMLTARSSEAEMLRALGLGAMDHITKPFSIPILLGRLDQTRIKAMAS
jgi:diguanylate cyclase (GGDEF)-like protein